MAKDINFDALYSEALFKSCYFLLMSYDFSQHPIFKIHQYMPFLIQEKLFHIREEAYTKLYVLHFSEGASQYHSQTVASITINASYLSVFRESSCGLLMSFKNQRVSHHIFFLLIL